MEKSIKDLNYFLKPGNMFVCWEPYRLATVVGSSVAICLSDHVSHVAGMNVFTFPKLKGNLNETYYGSYAIPKLLEMMFNLGSNKKNIQAHIVGGAFSKKYLSNDIGKKNVEIAQKCLKKNKISIVNIDVGGEFGRKVLFDTSCGEIIVYKAKSIREKDWYDDKSISYR